MKRRIRLALWSYAVLVGVVGFFVLMTYLILTPGSGDTGFSDPESAIDPAQARLFQLWFLWGLIGGAVAGGMAIYPGLQEED